MAMPGSPHPFVPQADLRAYRRALGRFATGVTIVTAMHEGEPIGITANSFTSVSLDPPLVLWAPDKASARHDAFTAAAHFAVHVLAYDQEALCKTFVRSAHAFNGLAIETNDQGVPLLEGCLARFECKRAATHDAGDHTLIIGQVQGVSEREASPLIFCNGAFTRLT